MHGIVLYELCSEFFPVAVTIFVLHVYFENICLVIHLILNDAC